jgi:ComF family protein
MRDPVIEELLDKAFYFVLPADCLGCGAPLGWRTQPLTLCRPCRYELPPPDREHCPLCGATTASDDWLCVPCRRRGPSFDRLLACWSYEEPAAAVMRAYKFERLEYLGGHIADAILAELGDQLADHDVVTAVPLHWRRHWQRGFNQAALIARPLAKQIELPYRHLLRRRRATAPQTGLARRARAENVEAAFEYRSRLWQALDRRARLFAPIHKRIRGVGVAGRRVLLVDDVATTGATVEAASSTLRRAGAAWITALVAAQTPDDRAGPRMSRLDRTESPLDILT